MAALMESWAIGDASLFCASMTGNRLHRNARDIRRGPAGTIGVAVQAFGVGRFEQHGRRQVVRPGDLMVVDLDAPYDFGWAGWGRSRCLHVPTTMLGLTHAQIRSAAPLIADNPLYAIVRRHVDDLCVGRDAEVPTSAAHSLGVASVTLIRTLLTVAGSRSREVRDPDALLRKIDRYVGANLADPGLSCDTIALYVGMAGHELLRITGEAGVDLPRWIEAKRLSAARDALRTSATGPDPVFAQAHGFTDLASFARAFTHSYGIGPRGWWEIRNER